MDVYTLQLLYVFVESLAIAQGDDPSLGNFKSIFDWTVNMIDGFRYSTTGNWSFESYRTNNKRKIAIIY